MSRVHAWRSHALLASLVPLAACAWFYAHRGLPYEFLVGQDEMEYADLARAIARGEGFTSGLIYPAELVQGVAAGRPNLIRAPAWPLALGGAFALFGDDEAVSQGLLLVLFCAVVYGSGLLAAQLAGPRIGFAAGAAVALSPAIRVFALLSSTEMLCTGFATLAFLLLARGAAPAWIGAACAGVYLTRYNGVVLLPIALLACAGRDRRWRSAALCAAGFALVASPWWIRNWVHTGNPLFSLYHAAVQVPSGVRGDYTKSLMHYLDPASVAAHLPSAGEKAWSLLPTLLLKSPFLSLNVVACLGLALACLRRQPIAIYGACAALLWTVAIAFVLPRGRYFAPLFPVVIALGAAGWRQLGPRAGVFGAAGVLLASLLPPVVPAAPDLALLEFATGTPRAPAEAPAWQHCISEGALVFGEEASEIAWRTDATAIWLTATEADFWQVVERHPVDFVYIDARRDLLTPRFVARFEPLADCGGRLYRARTAPRATRESR